MSEVALDHPALNGEPPQFGVWSNQQKRIADLDRELIETKARKEGLLLECERRRAAIAEMLVWIEHADPPCSNGDTAIPKSYIEKWKALAKDLEEQ